MGGPLNCTLTQDSLALDLLEFTTLVIFIPVSIFPFYGDNTLACTKNTNVTAQEYSFFPNIPPVFLLKFF